MIPAGNTPVVVVPEGLAGNSGRYESLPQPSFAYRAVLDHVVRAYAGRMIFLAPANDFGLGQHEQTVAERYLADRGVSALAVPTNDANAYVDTRGNARLLRQYLECNQAWPLPRSILVVGFRHARRARLCFLREGFALAGVNAIRYSIPREERIVRRLWFYRFPGLHRLYEVAALLRDAVRPPCGSGR